jgi:hypothetical protein
LGSLGRESEFGDEDGGGDTSPSVSSTHQGSCTDEHAHILRGSLNSAPDDADCLSAGLDWTDTQDLLAEPMNKVHLRPSRSFNNGATGRATTVPIFLGSVKFHAVRHETHLDSVKQSESPTSRVVEKLPPVLQRLKTVHHRSIVSVTHRGDEEEHL